LVAHTFVSRFDVSDDNAALFSGIVFPFNSMMKACHPMNQPISTTIPNLPDASRSMLIEDCIDAAQKSVSVFTRLYPDAARAAAVHADAMRAAGVALSPLAGLPVSIKDLLDVAGETTLAGSIVLKNSPPAKSDAPIVQRLRAAGAAILGKTNMTEFAFSGVGINPHYGTPANPADLQIARIPGGSSSGAAVSVATGICVAAIGSDTGGSIRIPAALCGLVGFKPTAHRVPTAGAIPLSTTLDTICAMTRSVDDCILVDSIIADTPLAALKLPLAGLRLALPRTLMLDEMDAHVADSFASALTRLSAAGAKIIEAPLPLLAELPQLNRFAGAESYAWHRELLAEHEADYDHRVVRRIKQGAGLSAADYMYLHQARREWITRMENLLMPFDALIMPTVPIVAPVLAELEASDDVFARFNALLLRNPSAVNYLNGCAISLPCHKHGTLPVGLTIAGTAMSDQTILAIARAAAECLGSQPA
jgi:aspartyl-tRNA(Asn)/glutamyl-tRNA(Gln) amidotransferase subunit A